MNRLPICLLAGLALTAAEGFTQTVPVPLPTPVAFEQNWTTGVISFVGSQTVQLNVLNINSVSTTGNSGSTTPVPACSVQMSFYDAQDRLLKQSAVTTVAPGTAVSLDMVRADVPAASATTPRIAVRGVVKTEPPPTVVGTTSAIAFPVNCVLVTTLELFDTSSGLTQSFSSDARMVPGGLVVPMAITNR